MSTEDFEKRVGFGPRLGAYLVDAILNSILSLLVFLPMIDFETVIDILQDDPNLLNSYLMQTGVLQYSTLLGIVYVSVEMLTGASPAKHMFGYKIGNPDGSPGDTPLYIKRGLIKYSPQFVSAIALFAGLTESLGFLGSLLSIGIFLGSFLALAEHKQALHDKLAKTAIYRKTDLKNYDPNAADEEEGGLV